MPSAGGFYYKRGLTKLFLLSLAQLFCGLSAFARMDVIPGSRYTSVRIAALGDSAFSLGDDMGTGLFYNPANLAKIRKFNLEIFNYSILGSSAWLQNLNGNSFNVFNLGSFSPTLDAHPNQRFGSGWSFFPSISFPYVTLGVLTQNEFAAKSNGDGTITYQTVCQLIPAIGTGARFFNGVLRLGYSLQYVNQTVGTQTGDSSSGLNYTSGALQGSGLSHTFGMSVVAPMPALPTFSVVVRNAFNTVYSSSALVGFTSNSGGAPATEPMTIDTAFSFNTRVTAGVVSHWSVAYRDLQNQSGISSPFAHLGAGVEFAIKDSFFLRAGIRTGYLSGGVAIKKPGTEVGISWFQEEIGSSYLGQADSKWMFQFRSALY